MFLHGDCDPLIHLSHSQSMKERLPDEQSHLHIMKDRAHNYLKNYEDLAEPIKRTLEKFGIETEATSYHGDLFEKIHFHPKDKHEDNLPRALLLIRSIVQFIFAISALSGDLDPESGGLAAVTFLGSLIDLQGFIFGYYMRRSKSLLICYIWQWLEILMLIIIQFAFIGRPFDMVCIWSLIIFGMMLPDLVIHR
jgi:hypothetical protein